jgi:hypothetical protein
LGWLVQAGTQASVLQSWAGAAAITQIWNNFVSHDVLQKVKESLQTMT